LQVGQCNAGVTSEPQRVWMSQGKRAVDPVHFSPHVPRATMTGSRSRPFSVSRYS
jgi:hypothetical protein